jgi:glycosidase
LAHAAVFTLPGMPIVYYGDEVGLEGGGDPDNRRVMPAEADLTPAARRLRETVAQLARARRCESALRRGPLTWLARGDDALAWRRTPPGAPPVDVVLNRGDAAVTLTLARDDVPVTLAGVSTQQRVSAHSVAVTVPAQSFAVLVPAVSTCAMQASP